MIALALAVAAAACTLEEEVPSPERRAQKLNKAIMCPVCPGESIDQSQNDLAADMRTIVAEKLEQGRSEQQIKAFFVERYGPSVLLEPPTEGFSLVVWVLPPVALLGALLALYFTIRLMRRSEAAPGGAIERLQLSDEERMDYFSRISAALDHDGHSPPPEANDGAAAPRPSLRRADRPGEE